MTGKKLILPAALLVGAASMVGFQAFAQTTTPTTTPAAQVQSTAQTIGDQNKAADTDIETNDDNGSASVSDTDTETNDDGAQAANQNSQQDPNQTDGETND